MAQYEAVIGLEVHVELKTNTKIFCHSSTEFGAAPNHHVCPVCLGLPGVLPVLNKQVLEYAIKAGLALNCEIADFSKFDRKNYYYPDLPKNYQISQYDLPIARFGHLHIDVGGIEKTIGVTRVHMEEDAGKLVHQGTISTTPFSLVDYNRTGVPLIEIVSEPDMRSADEAVAYLEKLKALVQYTGISDCKMQEGSLRCDANISVRPIGQTELGVKAEIKNMNSFKALHKAVSYEIERQIELLEDGSRVIQETRTWDEARGETLSLRSKEEAHDYRYFPDPDLAPLVIDKAWVQELKDTLPEMPGERKERLVRDYHLPEYDASILTASRELADYYEQCVAEHHQPKIVSNWIMGDLAKLMNTDGKEIQEVLVTPAHLGKMLELLDKGIINGKIAKTVFEEMYHTGKDPDTVISAKGLVQINDMDFIEQVMGEVIAANPKSVEDYRAGKVKAIGFLVGQVMKSTKGKANPGLVNELLKVKLEQSQ